MIILPGNLRLSDKVLAFEAGAIAEKIENIESDYGLDNETVIRLVTGAPHLPLDMATFALDCFLRLNETATERIEEEKLFS